ncbi:MAG: outer membrane protein assembly factor BamA [Planctomycetes bacterium]|nr:outer membrane protein assembly factor BamA [Planctomycetota bacterium]
MMEDASSIRSGASRTGSAAVLLARLAAAWLPAALLYAQVPVNLPPATVPAETPPAPAPAAPLSPLDGKTVIDLTVIGLERIDEGYVRNQIRTRAGEAYSQDQVQRDIARLLRTGRFRDVRATPELIDNQVRVVFQLVEKPEIAAIDFVGNVRFKAKDLLKELPFAVGDPLDLYEVRQGRDIIERMYREKGYAYAEVTYDEERLRQNEVVYTVTENQRVRVRRIRFEGVAAFSASELKRAIETKTYIWIFRTGDFDPDKVQRDAVTIQQYYRDRGWLDAEVSWAPEFQDVARENLTIVFRVNEGIHYGVREVRFVGNTVFDSDTLTAEMTLKAGHYLVQARLDTDIKKLETKYGSIGYIEARIVSSWVFAAEPGLVVLTLTITEGNQFNIGWIEVNGNFHTQEKVVRRELRFYPEEIYDVTKVRDSEQRLKETRLFSEVTIEPVVPTENPANTRDVLVTVIESPQTTQFIAGVGASSDSGIVGNIQLKNTNFDLKDWPRSWGEFFRGRSFRGAGQTMSIQFEPGTEFTRGRIDFREPYLFDMPIGFDTSLYLFDRGRDGYDERRIGGSFGFDHKFEKGILEDWIGAVSLRAEYVDVRDRQAFAAKDIRDVDGGNYLSSVRTTLIHDTTDSRLDPTRGHTFSASYEQAGAMGGDFFFGKIASRFVQHFTLATDARDRKSVLSLRAEGAQILGDAPVFERYYAGGIGSMRGFDYRGIGPLQGLRKNRVGGDFMFLTGAEYSFPLYEKAVRGVTFIDMGTVEKDFGLTAWRASVGAGVRLTLDILGTVPREFDLAFPISKHGDDDVRYFSFFIGLPFF